MLFVYFFYEIWFQGELECLSEEETLSKLKERFQNNSIYVSTKDFCHFCHKLFVFLSFKTAQWHKCPDGRLFWPDGRISNGRTEIWFSPCDMSARTDFSVRPFELTQFFFAICSFLRMDKRNIFVEQKFWDLTGVPMRYTKLNENVFRVLVYCAKG